MIEPSESQTKNEDVYTHTRTHHMEVGDVISACNAEEVVGYE